MKCNQCGSENVDNSAFCSKCGSPLQPSAPVATPIGQSAPIASGFNNLNAPVQTKKNPAHTVMIIECIVGAVVLVLIAIFVVWFMTSRSGSTEILSCTKDGKAVTQSVALTYDKSNLSKIEYTYIIDNTVDEDDLSTSDQEDLMSAAFGSMAFAEYDGHDGIDYYYSDKPAITTVSLVADLTKTNKTDTAELTEDLEDVTLDDAKKEYAKNGFTCTIK